MTNYAAARTGARNDSIARPAARNRTAAGAAIGSCNGGGLSTWVALRSAHCRVAVGSSGGGGDVACAAACDRAVGGCTVWAGHRGGLSTGIALGVARVGVAIRTSGSGGDIARAAACDRAVGSCSVWAGYRGRVATGIVLCVACIDAAIRSNRRDIGLTVAARGGPSRGLAVGSGRGGGSGGLGESRCCAQGDNHYVRCESLQFHFNLRGICSLGRIALPTFLFNLGLGRLLRWEL